MGATTCNDNRFEAIAKAREMLVSSTNIEDSPDEMAVLDTILFRFWQMGWIDALDVNARLKAENAKLKGFVYDMWNDMNVCYMQHEGPNPGDMDFYRDSMRELGIEVS